MCEIFGFSADKEEYVNEDLKIFYGHSNMHPHGWGLAHISDGQLYIEKESIQASKSNYLKERLAVPLVSNMVLAHIRYATIGNIDRNNCHPYTKRDNFSRRWTLIHNGTIFDYPLLNRYLKKQQGETDSERILLYIVDEINKKQRLLGRESDFKERFNVLDELVAKLSKGNKLNLIIYDGEYMYIHTNYKNSLYYLERENSITVSTQPLTNDSWENVEFTTLTAIKDGRFVAQGTNHGNEYVDNEETLKHLYQIFSNL